jgi:hypothetical protein
MPPTRLKNIPRTWAADVAVDGKDLAISQVNAAPGAIPQVFVFSFADAATNDITTVMVDQVRVIDVTVVKTAGAGAAGNTVQVKNEGNAITDAIDTNDADQVISRAATINDAFHDIVVGGALRLTNTKVGGNSACIVNVHCLKS